jgi:ribosomal protein S18 acetylase RimI-like enzyme
MCRGPARLGQGRGPPAARRGERLADPGAARDLIGILRRERPDVLHCHDPKPGFLGRIVGRLTGTPVVVNTVHGFGAARDHGPRRLPVAAAEWFAARWSRLEFYASAEDFAWARNHGIAVAGRSRFLGDDEGRFDVKRAADLVVEATTALAPERTVGRAHLRRATDADAVAIARLHRDTMPEASLPMLGDPFVLRFHRALIRDREAIVLVAVSDGRVIGFASGAPSTRRFAMRFALRHGIPGALDLAVGAGVRGGLRRLAESARYATSSSSGGLEGGELIAVAVDRGRRGSGTGSALSAAVVGALRAGGCEQVRVLVGASNDRALALYRSLGFRDAWLIETHRGVQSRVLQA